jgi:tetratricopeptide (TPR) repeat protein
VLKALQELKKDSDDPRIVACLQKYEDCIEQKDFLCALRIAEKLIALRGQASDWVIQGMCLWWLGQPKEALEAFTQAIELKPEDKSAWYYQSTILNEIGRTEEALVASSRTIMLDQADPVAWQRKAKILASLKRYEEAQAALEQAVKLGLDKGSIWFARGYLLGKMDNFEGAIAAFSKVIKLNETFTLGHATAHNNLGWLLCRLRRYDEASVSLQTAIELGYRGWFVFFNRAEALLALNCLEEGTVALDEALHHFSQAEAPNTDNTEVIMRNLFTTTPDIAVWRTSIPMLINLYSKHKVTSILGKGLVETIPTLISPVVSDTAICLWLEVWQKTVSSLSEFQIPLRLLDTAVRYRQTKGDLRVLLELPIEERELLKSLLGIQEPEEEEPLLL